MGELAWRLDRGLVNHIGEYAPFKTQDNQGAAMDLDPIFARIHRWFEHDLHPTACVSRLDLMGVHASEPDQPFYEPDGIHYIPRASRVIAERIAEVLAQHLAVLG